MMLRYARHVPLTVSKCQTCTILTKCQSMHDFCHENVIEAFRTSLNMHTTVPIRPFPCSPGNCKLVTFIIPPPPLPTHRPPVRTPCAGVGVGEGGGGDYQNSGHHQDGGLEAHVGIIDPRYTHHPGMCQGARVVAFLTPQRTYTSIELLLATDIIIIIIINIITIRKTYTSTTSTIILATISWITK